MFRSSPASPPVGFSFAAAAGPWDSGWFQIGIGDQAGGAALTGGSYEGSDMLRRGIRGSAMAGGDWGVFTMRAEKSADKPDSQGVTLDWTQGELSALFPFGRSTYADIRLYSTSSDDDHAHLEAVLGGTFPRSGHKFQLTAADRLVGCRVRLCDGSGRFQLRGGPRTVKQDDEWKYMFEGGATAAIVLGRAYSLSVHFDRTMELIERSTLRRSFPLADPNQDAQLITMDWKLGGEVSVKMGPSLTMRATLSNRWYDAAPVWRQSSGSLHWIAEPLEGGGWRGGLSAAWSDKSIGLISAGFTLDETEVDIYSSGLEFGDEVSMPRWQPWPLIPSVCWWTSIETGKESRFRLRIEGDTGREALYGRDIESSTTMSGEAKIPMRGGWQAWIQGAYTWGWDLLPEPSKTLSVGIGWSVTNPWMKGRGDRF